MAPLKNYYQILQVDPQAEQDVIHGAYRVLVRQSHPDVYYSKRKAPMEARMQEINEAYHVLGDVQRRKHYDGKWARQGVLPPEKQTGTLSLQGVRQLLKHPVSRKRLLLWAICTFLIFKFVFRGGLQAVFPVLAGLLHLGSLAFLWLVVGGLAYGVFLFYRRKR